MSTFARPNFRIKSNRHIDVVGEFLMLANVSFEQMYTRLSCETSLPQIPLAAMRVCELVHHELVSQEVLKVTASDPSLTAGLLRSASSPLFALSPKPVSDIRTALSILGVRGVKSVAMSTLMQSVVAGSKKSKLDSNLFVQHSTFVGIMAKYVFLRRKQIQTFETQIHGDEIFVAGIMHDLGIGLLAVSYPEIYDCLEGLASDRGIPTSAVFQEHYGEPLAKLTIAAFDAWKLPPIFKTLILDFERPWEATEEAQASAALNYSNWIAERSGFSERKQPPIVDCDARVLDLVGLPQEELPGAIQQVIMHTESCLIKKAAA